MDPPASVQHCIDEWAQVHARSLGVLESPETHGVLAGLVQQLEHCVARMYTLENAGQVVAEFEKELQLRQHLAVLLVGGALAGPQADMATALWRTQPYVHAIIQGNVA
ncbi:hypothetical protein GGF46_004200 [Coemansia sp. RSA 552]|nr:hypothetical protein GGF46_004200 [Coemansia sp. RSA 552]